MAAFTVHSAGWHVHIVDLAISPELVFTLSFWSIYLIWTTPLGHGSCISWCTVRYFHMQPYLFASLFLIVAMAFHVLAQRARVRVPLATAWLSAGIGFLSKKQQQAQTGYKLWMFKEFSETWNMKVNKMLSTFMVFSLISLCLWNLLPFKICHGIHYTVSLL